MTATPGTGASAGPSHAAGSSGHGGAPADPTAIDLHVRQLIDQIVEAVRDGDHPLIRDLLAKLAAVANTNALLNLRQQLYENVPSR
ncbi:MULTISPECIES: hypothetical protein [unclassified Streptomyces]|uniref:hypothetical protein n=1 Tax=unclassified Streptomyces TaxID=2593676 RepID=UPI0013A6DA24|nr:MULTISPECIES: hypothetical protein [unclassified Streptomyces]